MTAPPPPMPGPMMTGAMWMPSAPPTLRRLVAVRLQPIPVIPRHRRGAPRRLPGRGDRPSAPGRRLAGRACRVVGGRRPVDPHGDRDRHRRIRHGALQRPYGPTHGARDADPAAAGDGRSGHARAAGAVSRRTLLVGALYFWRVLGVDPVPQPRRAIVGPTMRRVLELGATIPFHAFFGVAIMMSTDLVVRFYASPPRGWALDPLADQRVGGGIAWGFTELPTLAVLAIMFWQWQRSDARAAARGARARSREDAELEAYNARLARLAAHDREVV